MAIYDTMQFIKPDVSTLCMGMAASMGSFLLVAGAKGKRFALPNSRVMIHQPSGGFQGQASDIEIHASEILKLREQLERDLRQAHRPARSRRSKPTRSATISCRPDEAKDYGLIDKVLTSVEPALQAGRVT